MSKLMLIDSTHPEETRVAVISHGQIEDFDFEARHKRQLRGNIYLAKVTRVEPSLQAAFVDYGGNRHGFLAFSEIHPDYYQIPQADRDALIAEALREEERRQASQPATRSQDKITDDDDDDDAEVPEDDDTVAALDEDDESDEDASEEVDDSSEIESTSDDNDDEDDTADDEESLLRRQKQIFQRKYKIQEVIRPRQVLLVQVVKEERGNKGAALTTYLSLAGRYCVLMPNTARSGGVSRKITSAADRKRLKAITSEFEIQSGGGLIVRTAGAKRTKQEIQRDFEYLTKLWKQIVSRTVESMAPCLIHEEGHLVLRAVRDLYDKDIQQIVVEGQEAYEEAKTFVEMLMPTHAKKVVQHTENTPLFVASGVEDQLESIFSPTVRLPSGGYIVINQTEALVAVDVNSGKATRERNVENTALKTNLEAAAEACRQMRLRDLAGLVVIDFIDMEENRNNRAVERKMAECLKIDRARVQTGRISQFGLFEISRQRRRAGVLELTSEPCPHCDGSGRVRSVESAALQVLRLVEARAADPKVDTVQVRAPSDVAIYILNEKRSSIAHIESAADVTVRIEADSSLFVGDFSIESLAGGKSIPYKPVRAKDFNKSLPAITDDEIEDDEEEDTEDNSVASVDGEDDEDGSKRRRRGRRGGRRRRGPEETAQTLPVEQSEEGENRNSRGRRRRGGRARLPDIAIDGGEMLDAIASAPFLAVTSEPTDDSQTDAPEVEARPVDEQNDTSKSSSKPDVAPTTKAVEAESLPATTVTPATPEPIAASAEATPSPVEADEPAETPAAPAGLHPIHGSTAAATQPESDPDRKRRMGWWSRKRAG